MVVKKIPAKIRNACDDYVTYHYVVGTTKEQKDNQACYAAIMGNLGKAEITLQPNKSHKTARLPNSLFIEWLNVCVENGLIDRKTKFEKTSKGIVVVVSAGLDRHLTYSTLCCYRWAEAFAKMIWQILKHLNMPKRDFTFWQALHYGLGIHYTYGSGHSFTHISKNNDIYNRGKPKNDLSHSIAMPILFGMSVDKRSQKTGQTNGVLSDLANKLGGGTPVKTTNRPGSYSYRPQTVIPILNIDKLEELIGPKWTPLYKAKSPTKASLKKLYDDIVRND